MRLVPQDLGLENSFCFCVALCASKEFYFRQALHVLVVVQLIVQ